MCIIMLYIPKIIMKSIMRINAYLDISLFAHFKYTVKIYAHNFTHLFKISLNNRSLLYTYKIDQSFKI